MLLPLSGGTLYICPAKTELSLPCSVNMPNIQSFYGYPFIGLLLNVMLTGLEIVQVWIYCWNYWDKDKKTFKFYIGFITSIDILCTALGVYAAYWYLVVNYGNVQNSGTVYGLKPYYVRRIYLVGRRMIWPIILVPLIVGGTVLSIVVAKHMDFAVVLADIVITVTMSWTLYHKKTGFARTDSMIITLMAYTINSGFLLSALGIAMITSYLVKVPPTLLYVVFFLVMSKCYINTLYAMLNSRDYLRDRTTTDYPDSAYNSFHLSSIRLDPPSEAYGSTSRQPGVTVTVRHHSTASDFARNKSDHT
ncbi:hypothetical protein EI94DRAFT_1783478 [Lactarius quietus]|nr:hypothetical protein EI94DRAFT_1783478 [Lactarius quietus]